MLEMVDGDYPLPGHGTMESGRKLPVFQRNMQAPPSSGYRVSRRLRYRCTEWGKEIGLQVG
jgi:hypothetical protein